jgi:hypothetical protein
LSTSFSRRERNKRGAERAVKRRATLVQRAARAPHRRRVFLVARPFFPRGGRRGDSGRTQRKILISTQATEGTFGMFSSPMTGEEFLKKINA